MLAVQELGNLLIPSVSASEYHRISLHPRKVPRTVRSRYLQPHPLTAVGHSTFRFLRSQGSYCTTTSIWYRILRSKGYGPVLGCTDPPPINRTALMHEIRYPLRLCTIPGIVLPSTVLPAGYNRIPGIRSHGIPAGDRTAKTEKLLPKPILGPGYTKLFPSVTKKKKKKNPNRMKISFG